MPLRVYPDTVRIVATINRWQGKLMKVFSVDTEACIHCGFCLSSCGRELLSLDEAGIPELPEALEKRCTRCGHCAAACPASAVRLYVAEGEDIRPILDENTVSPAQADQLMQSRRSIRIFKDDAVPEPVIADMLQTVRLAPSGGNNQMVRWILLRNRQSVKKAADLVAEWFDTVARHDPRHSSRYAIDDILHSYRAGKDSILRSAPHAALAYTNNKASWGPVDSAIALTYFDLAAHARGVGTCWGGYLTRATAEYSPLREYLGVPEENTVHCTMVFGYPDIRYHAIPVRNPLQINWI